MHRGDFLSQLGEGSSGAGRCGIGSASGASGPTQPLLAVLGTLSWPWASCSVPHPFWEPLRKKDFGKRSTVLVLLVGSPPAPMGDTASARSGATRVTWKKPLIAALFSILFLIISRLKVAFLIIISFFFPCCGAPVLFVALPLPCLHHPP